jgi:hypothetical protein
VLDGMKAQYPILPSRHPRGLACTPAKQLKQQQEGLPGSPGTRAAGAVAGGVGGVDPTSPAVAAEGGGGVGSSRARRKWGQEQEQQLAAGAMDNTGGPAAAAAGAAGQGAATPLSPAPPSDLQGAQHGVTHVSSGPPLGQQAQWQQKGGEEVGGSNAASSVAASPCSRSAAASPVTGDTQRVTPGVTATSPAPTRAPHSTPRDGLPAAAGHPDMSPASLWSRVTKIVGSLGKTKGRQGSTPQQQQHQETPGSEAAAGAARSSSGSKTKSRIGGLRGAAGPSFEVTADAVPQGARQAGAAAQQQQAGQGVGGRDPVVQQLVFDDNSGVVTAGQEQYTTGGATAGRPSHTSRAWRSQGIPLASGGGAGDDDTGPLDRRSVRSDQSGASSSALVGGGVIPPVPLVYCWPLVYEEGVSGEQERAALALVGSTSGAHLRAWLKGKQLGGVVWVARGKRRHELVQDVLAYDTAQQQRQQQLVRVSEPEGSSRGPSRAGAPVSGANSRSSSRNSMVRSAGPPLAAAEGGSRGYATGGSSILLLQQQQQQHRQVAQVIDLSGADVGVRDGGDGSSSASGPEQRRALWQQGDPAAGRTKWVAEASALPASAAVAAGKGGAGGGGGGGGAARMQLYKEAARRAWGSTQEATYPGSSTYPAVPAPGTAAAAGGGSGGGGGGGAGSRGPAMQLQLPVGYGGELPRYAAPLQPVTGHTRSTQPSPVLTSPTTRAADVAAAAARYKAGRAGPVQAPPPPALAAGAGGGMGGAYGGLAPPVLITQAKLQAQARR